MLKTILNQLGIEPATNTLSVRGDLSSVQQLMSLADPDFIVDYSGEITGNVCLIINDFSISALRELYQVPEDTDIIQVHPIDLSTLRITDGHSE